MAKSKILNELIFNGVRDLPEKKKKDVLDFIEYLKLKEDREFVDYVNKRTEEAIAEKKQGKKTYSVTELQEEYA